MSKIIVNQIESSDGTTDVLNSLSAVNIAGSGIGKILQIVDTTVTAESFSTTSTSDVEITGLSAAITPSSSSNKVLAVVMATWGGGNNNTAGFGLKRDASQIGSSTNASGSQRNAIAMSHIAGDENNNCITYYYMDSPSSTSEITYKATVSSRSGYTFYLNRSNDNTTSKQQLVKTVSKILLMEIAG